MKSRDFCYWLQGYFELNAVSEQPLSAKQVGIIQNHLAMVFKHEIDPAMGDEAHQEDLNTIHGGHSVAFKPAIGDIRLKC